MTASASAARTAPKPRTSTGSSRATSSSSWVSSAVTAASIVRWPRGVKVTATARRPRSDGARDTSPAWAPDGKSVAFVSDQSGRDEVWVIETTGQGARKLSDADTEKQAVAWAPDSKALAYAASDHKLSA